MLDILLVDDHPSVTFGMSFVLQSYGYTVRTAEDGAEALLHLSTFPCDVLITDAKMPVMDGLALAVQARALYPALFIIVMSIDATFNKPALDSGANLFIAKSGGVSDFIHAIKYLKQPPEEPPG